MVGRGSPRFPAMVGRGSPRFVAMVGKALQKRKSPKGCPPKKHVRSPRGM
uniref:Uncharacterized protein n=1 Tax=Arundo donax TaxID=35708 RepID=A0A0A9EP95_ARUDO